MAKIFHLDMGAEVLALDYGSNGLVYIPASREALNEWNFKDNGSYTAEQQKDDFWAYINQDDYLKNHKGEYAERGGAVMPWHHQLDFKFNQNFYLNVAGQKNTLQFGVDIKNLANLLNNSWGLYKTVNNTKLLKYTGKEGFHGFDHQVDLQTHKQCNQDQGEGILYRGWQEAHQHP